MFPLLQRLFTCFVCSSSINLRKVIHGSMRVSHVAFAFSTCRIGVLNRKCIGMNTSLWTTQTRVHSVSTAESHTGRAPVVICFLQKTPVAICSFAFSTCRIGVSNRKCIGMNTPLWTTQTHVYSVSTAESYTGRASGVICFLQENICCNLSIFFILT